MSSMTDENKSVAVPLIELLRSIPRDARYTWTDTDGVKAFHSMPIGRYAHEAADALASAAASAESLEAMRDAERLRALQADIDKPPHESRFSLYEYGTKVFAVRRCLDFEIERAIALHQGRAALKEPT